MDAQQLRNILESCLLVAGRAMSLAQLEVLFEEDIDRPSRGEIKEALEALQQDYEGRGIELVEVASGWRLQSSASMEHWVGRLLEERAPRYSRALLETLVLIAYRQPITRGEIEEVRGVAVSSNIMRTLQERDWIKEMGYKDVPGKPALWGTTKDFLDYFNLKKLDDLPTLAEARDLAEIDAALAAEAALVDGITDSVAANDAQTGEETADQADAEESVATEDTTQDSAAEDSAAEDSAAEGSVVADALVQDSTVTEATDRDASVRDSADKDAADEDTTARDDADLVSLAANLSSAHRASSNSGHGSASEDNSEQSASQNPDHSDTGDADDHAEQAVFLSESTAPDAALSASETGESTQFAETQVDGDDRSVPNIEASEISVDDLDVAEWKAPVPRMPPSDGDSDADVRDTYGSSIDGETRLTQPDSGTEQVQDGRAESDLRRVIDEFASEHQQQLDAEHELRTRHSVRSDDVARGAMESGERQSQPVTEFSSSAAAESHHSRKQGANTSVGTDTDAGNSASAEPDPDAHRFGSSKSADP